MRAWIVLSAALAAAVAWRWTSASGDDTIGATPLRTLFPVTGQAQTYTGPQPIPFHMDKVCLLLGADACV